MNPFQMLFQRGRQKLEKIISRAESKSPQNEVTTAPPKNISPQELQQRYGDNSPTEILSHRNKPKNYNSSPLFDFGEDFSKQKVENPPPTISTKTPYWQPAPPKTNSLESVANYGINQQPRKPRYIQNQTNYPPVAPKKDVIIKITGLLEWKQFQLTVTDLHELINFFESRKDSQSPQFLNSIKNYKNILDKKLSAPAERSATVFLERAVEVIQQRFYTFLRGYAPGLKGQGKESRSYYVEIDRLVKKYFENIGLKSADAKAGDNYRNWREHMDANFIPTWRQDLDNRISEISIQPYYFRYYDENGNVEKFWIDGECTVYRFGEGN